MELSRGAPARPRGGRWLRPAILAGSAGLLLLSGAYLQFKAGLYSGFRRHLYIAQHRVSSALTRDGRPEILSIEIKPRHLLTLESRRQRAVAEGVLLPSGQGFVPASVCAGDGQAIRARVRLKGDEPSHYSDPWKYSLRVDVEGEGACWGMRRFAIQQPATRNYAYEWLFHRLLRREGLLSLRYRFIRVTINGQDHGIYALEEQVGKEFLESQRRREGPILKFDDSFYWEDAAVVGKSSVDLVGPTFLDVPIEASQGARLARDPLLKAEFERAAARLEGFRQGKLGASDVFDVARTARFFAILDLVGGNHATGGNNLRFYHDPLSALLEPVGYDAGAGGGKLPRITGILGHLAEFRHPPANLLETFFHDPVFFRAYVGELERLSAPAYVEGFLDEADPELREQLAILRLEFPSVLFTFSREGYRANARTIRDILERLHRAQAFWKEGTGGRLEVEIANIRRLPLRVDGLLLPDGTLLPVEDAQASALPPYDDGGPLQYHTFRFDPGGAVPSPQDLPDARIAYRVEGASRPLLAGVARRRTMAVESDVTHRRALDARAWPWLEVDEASRTVRIKPGAWRLDRLLVIPAGYRVLCDAGTTLTLSGEGALLSWSPLTWKGTEAHPIRMVSEGGQGLAVVSAGAPSRLDHVSFEGLARPALPGWGLTGAVTFYRSPLKARDCRFVGARAEDALNVVDTDLVLEHVFLGDARSDALDLDFCTARLSDIVVERSGNDAIDLGGCVASLDRLTVRTAGDKGISVGEGSRLSARDVHITGAKVGLGCKDTSTLDIDRGEATGCRIGLAVYRKKAQFGPAALRANGFALPGAGIPYRLEPGCVLRMDGREMAPNARGVAQALYGEDDEP